MTKREVISTRGSSESLFGRAYEAVNDYEWQIVSAQYIHNLLKRLDAMYDYAFVKMSCNLQLRLEEEYLRLLVDVGGVVKPYFANGIVL